MKNDFDVVVLGSGPGGYVAAIRAAQLGLSAAIIERDSRLGGVCTLRGCIPTKALLHTADLLSEAQRGAEIGVVADGVRLDWPAALASKRKVVDQSSGGVSFLMKKNKIEVVRGTGQLTGPGKIRVRDEQGAERVLTGKNLILATGSEPRTLPGLAIDGEVVVTSDHILELPRIPKSLVVLGGGVVGVEFASLYSRFGTQVTVLEALPALLASADEELSKELLRSFRRSNVTVNLGAKVTGVERTGERAAKVSFVDVEGTARQLDAEVVLVSIGRRPNSEGIGLETLGIKTDRGFVPVDGQLRTSAPGVYAIGDLNPTPALAHVAMREGIIAAETIAGRSPRPLLPEHVPFAVYSSPEVAWIGLTEKQARERGYEVRVGKFPFSASGKARVLHQTEGLVKLVSDARYDELLGFHLIGPRVTELLAEAGVALELESTAEDFAAIVHSHPTLSEAVAEAAHAIHGGPIHI